VSRLKVLSERFGYLTGYQEWAEELLVMDKKLDEHADLLDRIKVLEGERDHFKNIVEHSWPVWAEEKPMFEKLLHRCLNTGLRDDKTRPLYLEVCRVLGVDPDKPWEEK